jgi:enoyl-CoA hydratase
MSVVMLERPEAGVGLVTLNRPQARNALNRELMLAMNSALTELEEDSTIGAIVLTGGDKFFSAGADIKEMTTRTFADAYLSDFISKDWEMIPKLRKPIIAAVAGFAVGGGTEIALSCDMVVADETARFGQPEVAVGTIPGGGGTQRLARLIGKGKTMELCLTGRLIDAVEAHRLGIVTRLVPTGQAVADAVQTACLIASHSRPVVMMIKDSVNRAFEGSLTEGLRFERRLLWATFALEDQTEAMTAFAERRPPVYKHR